MVSDDLESLLEQMLPGAGHRSSGDSDAPPFPAALDLQPRGVLGRGGSGWVYRAYDPVLDREVAVKISRPEGGRAVRDAMLAEARRTAALQHPSVLAVYRVQAVDGLLCIVFQLASPTTLATRLTEWRTAPDSAWTAPSRLDLLRDVIDAVALAHSHGIVHGDLKPTNISVADTRKPTVLDWGGLSVQTGTFSGTPAYAAPERLDGQPPTPEADVWALGALLYEVLTLRPLRVHGAGRPLSDVLAVWRDAAPPPVAEITALDPGLADAVLAALSPTAAHRPSAAALAQAVGAVLTGQADRSRRTSWARRHVERARSLMHQFNAGERRLTEEKQVAAVQRMKVPSWAPEGDKLALWSAEDRLEHQLDLQALTWTDAVEAALVASTLEPDNDETQQLLADIWYERLVMAETRGYAGEAALCLSRVRAHDRGRHSGLVDATARLSIDVEPADARVVLTLLGISDRRLDPVASVELTAPVHGHSLEPGSWLVTVHAPGHTPLAYPLRLERLEHARVRLRPRTASAIGVGWVLVPAGSFRLGGDRLAPHALEPCSPVLPGFFARRTPVTAAEWLAFLLELEPPERADHLPRQAGPVSGDRPLWPIERGIPTLGPTYRSDWPVVGVSLPSAQAFAAWHSHHTGRPVRLPREEEWEKLARGADGRAYPWGQHFDPSFCHMRDSRSGRPTPVPVGSITNDTSVYGAVDLAGGVREWTLSTWGDGRAVVRGGGWLSDASACRLAARMGHDPTLPALDIGFRLVSAREAE
jgi:formylglycine-generating enzyme required for sulfatase activity